MAFGADRRAAEPGAERLNSSLPVDVSARGRRRRVRREIEDAVPALWRLPAKERQSALGSRPRAAFSLPTAYRLQFDRTGEVLYRS